MAIGASLVVLLGIVGLLGPVIAGIYLMVRLSRRSSPS